MNVSQYAIATAALLLGAGLAGSAAATNFQDMEDPWLEPTYQWYGADAEWPDFVVAPRWPKPLPNNWIIGQVGGIAVDRNDHIWLVQRARSLDNSEAGATDAFVDPATGAVATNDDGVPIDALGRPRPFGPIAECCLPAPAIMKFDREGNLLDAWGGPADEGYLGSDKCREEDGCVWPAGEHGLYVDHNDFVYLAGNGSGTGGFPWAATHGADAHVLKFTSDGTHVLTVGRPGPAPEDVPNSNDADSGLNGTPQLYLPADTEVDARTNELYIADGYGNHRVVVVDAETGQYKRHWGAYGQVPVDDVAADEAGPYAEDRDAGITPQHFRNPVHCVRITKDRMVYVCDRANNRIQVFNTKGDFIEEKFIRPDTLHRRSLQLLATFGRHGRNAGQFHWVHNVAVDSEGNIYTAEVDTGKRAQKFLRKGVEHCSLNRHDRTDDRKDRHHTN